MSSSLGLESTLAIGLLPVRGGEGGGGVNLLEGGQSFFDQTCLGQDIGKALGDSKGTGLGVHV